MPATDLYPREGSVLSAPVTRAFTITPHNTDEIDYVTTGVLCTVAGNAAVYFRNSSSSVTLALLAGVVYPFRLTRVLSTGTTATLIGLT